VTAGKETVALEEAIEQVQRVCVRLALLHIAFARTLVNELGEEKGRELVLKAIRDYGVRIGSTAKAKAMAQGLDNTPANFQEDLPRYGMHERRGEVVEVGGETRRRVYGCVMGKVWNDLGEGALGRLYCYVDPAKYMAFNPDFKLAHTKAIPDGDAYCEFVLRPTTAQERRDFADENADWSYMDLIDG
jgi:predicted hydrocarbon binding protein